MAPLTSRLFAGDELLQRIADDIDRVRISRTQNRSGDSVRRVQEALLLWRPDILPRHGADGKYGSETAAAVHRFKVEELGVPEAEVIDDVGPRTVQRLDEIARAGETPARRECTVSAFNVPTGRSGCTRDGTKAGERFNMEADFNAPCACCEYRQFVRGTFTVNGRNVQHLLPDPAGGPARPMLPRPAAGAPNDNFLEDGVVNAPAGVNTFYGHRSEGNTDTTDRYLPDRPDGCQYRGNDFPGIRANTGDTFAVDLDFRGQIIDTCNGNAVKNTVEWTVNCTGTI